MAARYGYLHLCTPPHNSLLNTDMKMILNKIFMEEAINTQCYVAT
jgi:hypothetical protein